MKSLREFIEWLMVLEHLFSEEEEESLLERLTKEKS